MLDAAHQRLGKLARPALGHRHAIGVDDAWHQERAHAGTQLVGHLQVFGDQPHDVKLEQIALEILVDHVERRAVHHVEDEAALIRLVHHRHERPHRERWLVEAGHEHRQRRLAGLDELAIGLGVVGRELGDALAGSVEVLPGADHPPVLKHRRPGQLGIDVFEPESRQEPELVVPEHRIALDHYVYVGVLVMRIARSDQLACRDAAAEMRLALEHEDLLARLGHVGRRR